MRKKTKNLIFIVFMSIAMLFMILIFGFKLNFFSAISPQIDYVSSSISSQNDKSMIIEWSTITYSPSLISISILPNSTFEIESELHGDYYKESATPLLCSTYNCMNTEPFPLQDEVWFISNVTFDSFQVAKSDQIWTEIKQDLIKTTSQCYMTRYTALGLKWGYIMKCRFNTFIRCPESTANCELLKIGNMHFITEILRNNVSCTDTQTTLCGENATCQNNQCSEISKRKLYYRLEENECNQIYLFPQEVTSNDYLLLEDCEKNIKKFNWKTVFSVILILVAFILLIYGTYKLKNRKKR